MQIIIGGLNWVAVQNAHDWEVKGSNPPLSNNAWKLFAMAQKDQFVDLWYQSKA